MDLKKRVALRIKSIRKRRGITQERLAERTERSVDAIGNLERGISLPSFETLERLALTLQVPIRDFFDFDERDESDHRLALMTALNDAARSLSDADLEVALNQIEALAGRKQARSTERNQAR